MLSEIRTGDLCVPQQLTSSSVREKTVPGTQWYLACTEGSTANHREPEVAVRRNRAV
jgi:hypothetical protein